MWAYLTHRASKRSNHLVGLVCYNEHVQRNAYLPPPMASTQTGGYMILPVAVLFVLVELPMPQSDRVSDKLAGICRLVFLLQLYKTKRIYNVSH